MLSLLLNAGGWVEGDRDPSCRVAASEKQGEPDTALNQLSRIQDSDIRQDDSRFHQRQKERVCIYPAGRPSGSGTELCPRVWSWGRWAAMSLLHPEATVIAQQVVVCSCGSSTGRRLGDLLPKDECP